MNNLCFLKRTLLIISSFEANELDVEEKCGIRWNDARVTSGSIRVVWAASQLCPLTHTHLSNPLIPTFDDLSMPNLEGEGLPTVPRRVELLTVLESPSVVNHHGLSRFWEGAAIPRSNALNVHAHYCCSKSEIFLLPLIKSKIHRDRQTKQQGMLNNV